MFKRKWSELPLNWQRQINTLLEGHWRTNSHQNTCLCFSVLKTGLQVATWPFTDTKIPFIHMKSRKKVTFIKNQDISLPSQKPNCQPGDRGQFLIHFLIKSRAGRMKRSAFLIMLSVVLFSRAETPEQEEWLVGLAKICFRENTWRLVLHVGILILSVVSLLTWNRIRTP